MLSTYILLQGFLIWSFYGELTVCMRSLSIFQEFGTDYAVNWVAKSNPEAVFT